MKKARKNELSEVKKPKAKTMEKPFKISNISTTRGYPRTNQK